MQIKQSAEDYLETILMLKEKKANVRSIDIAGELNFSKPSVSIAMKKLEENGYITRDDLGYINLTEKGIEIASKVYEKHKFIAVFLQYIGVDEKIAKIDACKVEHILSEESFEKLKEYYYRVKKEEE